MILVFLAVLASPAISDWTEQRPEFVFARLACSNRDSWMYWPQYWPDNPPWRHDYPESDEFIIGLLHELTGVRVTPRSYEIVKLDSQDVFKYPFLYLSEPGFLTLNDKEIANLGEYIRRGGFIMADDFRTAEFLHGPEELEVLRDYLKLAVADKVVGQSASRFEACLTHADKKENTLNYQTYTFLLPSHDSVIQKLKSENGIDCWPSLYVEVDLKSQKIRRTLIYIQYL